MAFDLDGIKSFFQDTTVAGVAGSIASLKFVPGVSWATRAAILVTGAAFAFYALGPALLWLGVTSVPGAALSAFAAGFFGYNILAKSKEYFDKTSLPDIITNLIGVIRGKP